MSILSILNTGNPNPNGSQELSFQAISYLTFEAVLEVVIISFAGYIAARAGMLNTTGQKIISRLNVDLFTPCLVFSKLASSLSLQKMADLVVIPIFFAVSTAIAYGFSRGVSMVLQLNDPETDFVTAMAVFGNSNSLPVSLTLSLAYTLPDLLWDELPDDSSDKVASRGILYLLIFQQLGQILRWSWGFNTLLRKRSHLELNDYNCSPTSGLLRHKHNDIDEESNPLLHSVEQNNAYGENEIEEVEESSSSSSSSIVIGDDRYKVLNQYLHTPTLISRTKHAWYSFVYSRPVQVVLGFMNPPLYAMFVSVIVASVPFLQNLFFAENGSFIGNTITKSVSQMGSVSIPLTLIVLGSNLNPSSDMPKPSRHHGRIIVGSLLSRMILPPLVLLPIIAFFVKYVNISIMDDPIFLIVAFILTISPPAIQLSQIIQINNIYQSEMAGVLFWGYVILTLPTTIFIVVTSLEVLKWAL